MYNILPETEGRTLEDIEIHFADNNRKLTDHHIARNSADKSKETESSTAVWADDLQHFRWFLLVINEV